MFQIIEVLSFKAVRSKIISASITNWTGESGICDKYIFFDKHCIVNGGHPTIGSKVSYKNAHKRYVACRDM